MTRGLGRLLDRRVEVVCCPCVFHVPKAHKRAGFVLDEEDNIMLTHTCRRALANEGQSPHNNGNTDGYLKGCHLTSPAREGPQEGRATRATTPLPPPPSRMSEATA